MFNSFVAKAFTRASCWVSSQAESLSRRSNIVVQGSLPQVSALPVVPSCFVVAVEACKDRNVREEGQSAGLRCP